MKSVTVGKELTNVIARGNDCNQNVCAAAKMIPFEINIRENRGTGQRQIKQKQIKKLNIITKTDPTRR